MFQLTNLFVSPDAFKVGISPSGKILSKKVADAHDGTLLVSGNSRKGEVKMQVSQVAGHRLVAIHSLSKELQMQLLEKVKAAIHKARLAVVFLYEAAWRRASLRTELAAEHRLHSLPQEVASRHRKAGGKAMYQLGARATVMPA